MDHAAAEVRSLYDGSRVAMAHDENGQVVLDMRCIVNPFKRCSQADLDLLAAAWLDIQRVLVRSASGGSLSFGPATIHHGQVIRVPITKVEQLSPVLQSTRPSAGAPSSGRLTADEGVEESPLADEMLAETPPPLGLPRKRNRSD